MSRFNLQPETVSAVLSAPTWRQLRTKIAKYLSSYPDAQVVRRWHKGRWYCASLQRSNKEQADVRTS